MADYILNSSGKAAKKAFKSNAFIDHSICVTGMELQLSIWVFSLRWTENEKTPPIYNAGVRTRKGIWVAKVKYLKCFDNFNSSLCFVQ